MNGKGRRVSWEGQEAEQEEGWERLGRSEPKNVFTFLTLLVVARAGYSNCSKCTKSWHPRTACQSLK